MALGDSQDALVYPARLVTTTAMPCGDGGSLCDRSVVKHDRAEKVPEEVRCDTCE